MLQSKFQDPLIYGSEDFFYLFTIYWRGSHLGHMTWTIYIKFRSPFSGMVHMDINFDCGFKEDRRRTDAKGLGYYKLIQ